MATADQLKALIMSLCLDETERAQLGLLIEPLWSMYAGYSETAPGLQYLLTRREALRTLQNMTRQLVDTKREGDRSVSLSQRFEHLQTMIEETNTEIAILEGVLVRRRRVAAIGTITRTTPIADPSRSAEDAELVQRRLRGDAYLGGAL